MPETDALSIYSMKSNPFEQEKCIVELIQDGRKIKYVLNPKTRIFEEMRERSSKKNRTNRNNISIGQNDDGR